MDEKEFKKLAANSRDWLIYQMLSERSKETVVKEIKSEHVSGVSIEEQEKQAPKGETTVEETITGKVVVTTSDSGIIWTTHNNIKYKACKYKCGNYVSWDNNTKQYLHYDAEFKLIGADCPKYGGGVSDQ